MVTRETLTSLCDLVHAPEGAADRLWHFHDLLLTHALPRGFLGPREGDRILERHVLEAGALGSVLGAHPVRLVDVGAGAGLPGIVLACLGHDVTLVEAEGRRARFLEEVVRDLDLAAEVVADRAEIVGRQAGHREVYDWAV